MASTSLSKPVAPGEPPPPATGGIRRGSHTWLTPLLDGFLSEHLRQAPPSELLRYRVLIGVTVFSLLFTSLYLVSEPFRPAHVPMVIVSLCYLSVLALARKATSLAIPGLILCAAVAVALVFSIFMNNSPIGGVHATSMLVPAFAVYMVGPRPGLLFTAFLCVAVELLYPLYRLRSGHDLGPLSVHQFLTAHVSAAIALMGGWLVSSLHSTARDAAQEALERTLKTLRESEGKLLSVIESTEDLVCSLDTHKRVLTANAAMRRAFRSHHGQEILPGQEFLAAMPPELQARWSPRLDATLTGQRMRLEDEYRIGGKPRVMDISLNPILGAEGKVTGLTLSARDITERKEAEARLSEMHRTLVDISRQAGMAEVATGVLHNVGNTLNSVNISASLLRDQLRTSRVAGLLKAAQLLREHSPDFGTFFSTDPRGQRLPDYFIALSEELEKEREALRKEVNALSESVDHIKSIVSMQQRHARAAGVVERLPVPELIEEALRLHAGSIESEGILIEREYAEVPPILVDRHKLLQILINLLSNARHALKESSRTDKRLRIRIRLETGEERLVISVSDNGVGIAPEYLSRLFSQGFTTKKSGHGFGLHISALAATEMNGRLSCTSAGKGQGATFTLALPLEGSAP
ncbi:nitrogen regulation protein NR(II) [Vitiosangium sp. GDMCC 1.1324]|uniref:two-component system sensor histidine kinase NtrB n=1 Tax=Vitiosangium sp. (strain GDMCC 1.1324) TaxID=2138576 RepID=UPI000D349312|nr:ATP-binding protein [Vitiosangium sp. GDMCC 1.1324]PTL81747.1 nitrogen regulation protein NtrB [Vitiosangium sp. GDMCC 1.1324]